MFDIFSGVFLGVFAVFKAQTVFLFCCFFSCCGFCPVVLLFFRVLEFGFFGLLLSGAEDCNVAELCVFLTLFLLVFVFFLAKFRCYICVFLHVCSPSLALLALLLCFLYYCCLCCLLLFGAYRP